MRYFSMFSGIGGFEKGIEDAFDTNERTSFTWNTYTSGSLPDVKGGMQEWGHEASCVGFSEIDKNAINIYKKHYPGHKNYGSAFDIKTTELPDFDLLVGGFPCQAFSIAGKRLGFQDTRGTLFFEIARILSDKRPRNFLLENVKGLLSHDEGKTFQTILGVLSDLGYWVEWQVLNSKSFGVPQNRERVFIVGYIGGEPERKVFPIEGSNGQNPWPFVIKQQREEVKSIATRHLGRNGGLLSDVTGTIQVAEVPAVAVPIIAGYKDGVKETDISATIAEGCRIRRLTPVECERLQGFPDDWTKFGADGKVMSDSARYKACGNAVTTNVIRAIVERLNYYQK